MAVTESRVPMTLRDFFFSDPFFQGSWEDFDKLRQEMKRESSNFWSSVEKEMSEMESRMSSFMRSSMSSSMTSSSSSSLKKEESKEGSASKELISADDYSPWFFPRRWMLPKLFSDDITFDSKMKSLDLFQHKDEQVIRIKNDDSKFEVSLDVHDFRPDEIKVNIKDSMLSIEAKHEEKTDNKVVMKHFSRSYTLPESCMPSKVESNLSSDGILVITAPKQQAVKADPVKVTKIPVEHK